MFYCSPLPFSYYQNLNPSSTNGRCGDSDGTCSLGIVGALLNGRLYVGVELTLDVIGSLQAGSFA
jgi:hypothetical protein